MRIVSVVMLAVALAARAAVFAEGDDGQSVKEDFKEAGHAIKDGAEKAYDKTKDATLHGVGTAVDKTGEGLNKAGQAVEGAGEKVKDKADE